MLTRYSSLMEPEPFFFDPTINKQVYLINFEECYGQLTDNEEAIQTSSNKTEQRATHQTIY